MNIRLIALPVAVLLATGAAQAAEFNQVDAVKSTLAFSSKQMGVPVPGSFKRFTSQISFDPAKPTAAHTTLEIDLASVDAGSKDANDEEISVVPVIASVVSDLDAKNAKTLSSSLLSGLGAGVVLLGLVDQEKPTLCLSISEQLTREKGWHAGNIIKELAREIEGGGGGQAFYATAGGSRPEGLDVAISKLKEYIK